MPGRSSSLLTRLNTIFDRLLDPENGCPWDIKQTPASLKMNLLEETYELLTAIDGTDPDEIKDELGDCLFLLAFITRLYQQQGLFSLEEALESAMDKIVHRHPHVFGDAEKLNEADEVKEKWHQLKQKEERRGTYLSAIPDMPALMMTHRLTERAGRVGFDWSAPSKVLETLELEIAELKDALDGDNQEEVSEELGDVLFTLANLARHLNTGAEESLRKANTRFRNRFEYIEKRLKERGLRLEDASLAEMDEIWDEAKKKGL
jgi:MazG family protein